MSLQSRCHIMDQIARHLSAPVLAYVTGDRPGLQTQIGADQVPLFPRHLEAVGKHTQLCLLLYTRGGDTNVPWSIVSFMREYCDRLTVLVPFWAHSSGTLLALGADEIQMTRFATLSPIDPTVANAFNPQDPANPASRFSIAVEDVLAFMEMARENLDGDDIGDAFKRLAEAVHPLALGNVKRSINQIRQLAKKLISVHPPEHSEEELSNLVTRLTTQFYSHQHLISRTEALEMDLPIVTPDDVVEQLLLDYHAELKTDLDLMQQFDPAHIWKVSQPQGGPGQPGVPGQPAAAVASAVTVTLERAYVETTSTCDAFVTRGTISQQMMQGVQMLPTGQQVSIPQTAIALEIDSERWEQLA